MKFELDPSLTAIATILIALSLLALLAIEIARRGRSRPQPGETA